MFDKYKLYIGLNDRITKTRICGDDLQVITIIKTVVKDCTITFSKGVYTYQDGTTCIEDTAIIEIIDFNSNLNIKEIIKQLGNVLNQESIAVEYLQTDSELVFM